MAFFDHSEPVFENKTANIQTGLTSDDVTG